MLVGFFLAISAILVILAVLLSPVRLGEGFRSRVKRSSERGIYITAHVARLPRRFNELKAGAKSAGLNTLVIDAKETLSRPFIQLVRERKLNSEVKATPDPWLSQLAKELHDQGFIVTARLVVFKDDHLALARPDLAVRLDGDLYRDRKGGKWTNPYQAEVRLYNQLIAEAAALSGVDEIQFDYIRFPAEGRARFANYPGASEGVSKVDIICQYLREAKERLKKYNVSLALDIFGVTAWQSKYDIEALGQDLKRMAPYLDVISPMLYPSHFHFGYDGFANPGSEPYYFMYHGLKRSQEILSGEAVKLVPWLQGFNMRSPNYGPEYIREQVRACHDLGIDRYLIWNASNIYDLPFAALRK